MPNPLDSFTETRRIGFGSNFGGSLMGMILAPLLVLASVVGLFWNEGRAVTTARSLAEGAGLVVSADPAAVAPDLAGKLVHVAGPLKLTATLTDRDFPVSAVAAVLQRKVQMYQWVEDKETRTVKKLGGGEEQTTTYRYSQQWQSREINSAKFRQPSGHSNPAMRYQGQTEIAEVAELGAYRPGRSVLQKLGAGTPLPVEAAQLAAIQQRLASKVSLEGGGIYLGADPARPQIGDLRISFSIGAPSALSVIGAQEGSGFAAYQTEAGDALLLVRGQMASAAAMFKQAVEENVLLTWVIRAVGSVVMLLGFRLLAGPLVALGNIVPLFGSLISGVATVAALIMTAIVAPVVIATAWLWYRPLVAIAVLAASAAVVYGLRQLSAARPAATAQPVNPA